MILIVIAACVAIGFRATPAAAQIISSGPLDFEERLIVNNVGGYIYGIGAADLDGDGDLDLTSADSIYDELMWYENDGQGNLTQRLIGNYPGGYLERHDIGDVNGDGTPDVVIVDNFLERLLWFENDGTPADGVWDVHTITTGFPRAYDVVLADLDSDGDLDAAASAFRGDQFAWFENPGPAGVEGTWTRYNIDNVGLDNTRTIDIADFNGDGKVDLLGTSTYNHLTVWYENSGDPAAGPWQEHLIDNTTLQPTQGHPVDMDGDGDSDVIMASGMRIAAGNPDSHKVEWYENDGSGGTWTKYYIGDIPYGFEAVWGDLDGDGDLDVIASGCTGGIAGEGEVSWFENPGDPKDPWTKHLLKNYPWASQVIVMDLDGNGSLDIAASGEDGTFYWWKNLREVPLQGDLHLDGIIDALDEQVLKDNWGQTVTPGDKSQGDADGDGFVGFGDLNIVRAEWGLTAPTGSSVPEPGSLAMLALGGLVLLLPRRHYRI